MTVDQERLIQAAKVVRQNAYAPFSEYRVGAALLDETGKVHTGCNVENSAYPEGTCAEANAIAAMIAAGGRRIVAIAAVGGRKDLEACTPCGGCRQKISEFADENTRIFWPGDNEAIKSHGIEDLLPGSFRLR